MQDSFDASAQEKTPQQTSEQTPAVAERKSGKGWMVAAIILLIGVIALDVTEFLAYQEISKKDEEIAKKDAEIANLKEQSENKKSSEDSLDLKGLDLDGPGLTKLLNLGKDGTPPNYEYQLLEIRGAKISKDGKYLYIDTTGTQGVMGSGAFVYKTLPDGQWKYIGVAGNGVSQCKDYSKEALEIKIDYGQGETEKCEIGNSNTDDDFIKISDYYNDKYKENK